MASRKVYTIMYKTQSENVRIDYFFHHGNYGAGYMDPVPVYVLRLTLPIKQLELYLELPALSDIWPR